jgi:ABC-type tungstate transport system permease subunit
MRLETYAHEEFVLIGPFESPLGEHGNGNAVVLMQDVARANYKTFDAKVGSLEYDKAQELFIESGDRKRGGLIATELEGTAFVKQAVESRAVALVNRSSVLQAASQGSFPHRIYREGDPDLVLRIAIVEVHPAKTRRTRKPELFDWLMGEKGKALVENFGERQFGYPVFGVGEPEEGHGARVPELHAKKGLEVGEPDPEQASP